MMNLKGKSALVTGGGTGIGRAVSLALADRGAAVAVNYSRSRAEAEETVREIVERGGRAIAVRADVSIDAEVREMAAAAAEALGGLDILVNNASITRHIALDDLEAAEDEVWDTLFAVNVKGMFYCARAAAPFLKRSGQGAIVNVGSIAGSTGLGSSLPYAVSKSAVHGLTRSLARALAPDIRVSCAAPGAVETRWWAGREERMRQLAGHLPLQRITTPEEVAELVVTLIGLESMTGQVVTLDGGQTM
ncbi:putative Short-chain dehydrogenase/reductase YusR [Paenibacillus mucilaginosus 3016]|uniref:3-ketoacyl-ACP reductase n=3 Tax=Paenibacillus mucilaginosus TaxID=61624 RepID=I0BR71_9BACL|nr:putative Short-chain dehydrogenase/reductase YusR [Paenibacillus mucilaginosus 3016]AFH64868.2 3-ketoacyl-ACP reductase [Paenibacillus mucilaginosus K02]WFA21023.1 SDR family oxidoreductase [Paenibacillus mucilaginosus]